MRGYGPHGRATHDAGGALLGHGLHKAGSDGIATDLGGASVALDGRIDNRQDLAAALGVSSQAGDAQLVLAAYRAWGVACADHLEGDFAFALWDPRDRQMLVARDRIGVRPVYYHDSASALLIASHPAAILALAPELGRKVDEGVAAAFAAGEAHPADRTIHPGLARLPAAHLLVASPARMEVCRYFTWQVRQRAPGSEPPERFADLLRLAVERRVVGPARIGAMLSGGLDSSSIVTIASKLASDRGDPPLRTYSQVFPNDPAGDERAYIEAIIGCGGLDPVFQPLDSVAPFAQFDAMAAAQSMPFNGPNLATTRRTHFAAANDGIGVLLDGHGGDEAVSSGVAWLYDLAYRGRFMGLWHLLRPLAKAERQSSRRLFTHIVKEKGPWRRAISEKAPPDWLARDVRAAVAPKPPCRPGMEGMDEHLGGLVSPYFTQALEMLGHAAADAGIELRFPLLDRELLQWCLAAPGGEKLGEGQTRYLLRRGMKGILPDIVRLRRDKYDFTGHLLRGMISSDSTMIDRSLEDRSGRLRAYFSMPALRRLWQAGQASPGTLSSVEVQALWRAVALGRWLERNAA